MELSQIGANLCMLQACCDRSRWRVHNRAHDRVSPGGVVYRRLRRLQTARLRRMASVSVRRPQAVIQRTHLEG